MERESTEKQFRTNFGVTVSNLPRGTTSYALRDYFKKIGEVAYAAIHRSPASLHSSVADGLTGTVEYLKKADVDAAVERLNNADFSMAPNLVRRIVVVFG